MNYNIGNTLNFTYHEKDVWGTIIKFGTDFVTLITKDGYRNYKWNKMSPVTLYRCGLYEFIKNYQWHGDTRFKYLYDFYGSFVQSYPWKQD